MRRSRLPILTISLALAGCDAGILKAGQPGPQNPPIPFTGGGSDVVVTVGGKGTPFDPKDSGSTGVKLDKDGGLVIDVGNFGSSTAPILWIANSTDGTVSKIETRTMTEVARYITGPEQKPDPSRSTVGLTGDVVVANRAGSSATKIAADKSRCIDKNGNGVIDTSTGPNDVKPWGKDECVLWNTPFEPNVLARAAAYDAEIGADGEESATVWIGLYNSMEMKQLDSRTGKVLATVDVAPVRPYGAAIDRFGNVWVRGGMLARIDKQHKVTRYVESPCGYGLAVDEKGRPWTSGGNCLSRFDPQAGTWETVQVGNSFNRGLAVDGKGSVWIASTSFGVHQVDMKTMQIIKSLPFNYSNFVGIAVDFDGKIWTVSQGSSMAIKIDPDTYKTQTMPTGNGPYTYSDMTGFQLRNAMAPLGKWHHVFQGCDKDTSWGELAWQAATPPGTLLTVKGRTGADAKSLAAAPWTVLGKSPPAASPLKLDKLAKGALLEVEIILQSADEKVSPMLQSLSLSMNCIKIG